MHGEYDKGMGVDHIADEGHLKLQPIAVRDVPPLIGAIQNKRPGRGLQSFQERGRFIKNKRFKNPGIDTLPVQEAVHTGLVRSHHTDGFAKRIAKSAPQQRAFKRRQPGTLAGRQPEF